MALDFTQLEESSYLLDLLIQMEDVLDSMDVFAFKNWFDAEIVEGPSVGRYWLSMTLKRNYRNMPDPRAAKRLVRQGVMVHYNHVENKQKEEDADGDEGEAENRSEQKDLDPKGFWLIKISIPRRLITEINSEEIAFYDDDVDVEDVQDANDEGMDDESPFDVDDHESENAPTPDGEPQPPAEAAPPPEPQGKGKEGQS